MEKTIINERTGWEYELQGDYYYPTGRVQKNGSLTPSELSDDNEPGEEKPIGVWGQRHLRYIKQERKALYTELLTSGRLEHHLSG